MSGPDAAPPASPARRLNVRRGIVTSLVIAAACAVVALLGGLGLALFVGGGGCVLNVVGTLLAALTLNGAALRLHGARALVYFVLAMACLPLLEMRRESAEAAGQVLITALERYRALHGDYPKVVDMLQPELLAAIPPAYTTPLGREEFVYRHGRGAFFLIYDPVAVTPYIYDSTTGAWRLRD
ncbi:MAG: hypothetical protein KDK06_17990 [Gammaproteobacteria bacterium]|nr:hypothetical protein [Gammaproteobacteria bacterium]